MSSSPPQALLQAYLDKRAMLVRYFTARARDAATAEDIVQEIYLKIVVLGEDYVVEHPPAYLFATGTRLWLNRLRSSGRSRLRDGEWLSAHHTQYAGDMVDDAASAETTVAARQEIALVDDALDDLPEKTRTIFKLLKLEGLTQIQVATRLNMSKSSVEKHQYAAVRYLSRKLGRQADP